MPAHPTFRHSAERADRSAPLRDRALSPEELDQAVGGPDLGADAEQVERLRQQLEVLALAVPHRDPRAHIARPADASAEAQAELETVAEARRAVEETRRRLVEANASAPAAAPRPAPSATTAAPTTRVRREYEWDRMAPPPEPRPAADARTARARREYEWEHAVKEVFERSHGPEPATPPRQPGWRTAIAARVAPRERH